MRRTLTLCFCCILVLVVFVYWRIPADAFNTYTASPGASGTNCAQCHGDFRASPYTSLSDGTSWGDDLHDVHRLTMVASDCNTCHGATRNPVERAR